MKELSVEEKVKAYDEAIRKAKDMLSYKKVRQEDMEYIFPELKEENDDEKIRKWLICYFKEVCDNVSEKEKKGVIAWLEKQGEPVEINPTEFDTRLQSLIGKFDSMPKEELIGSLSFWLNVVQNDGTYKDDEKQGKQKPIFKMKSPEESLGISSEEYNNIVDECLYGESKFADKVEPKFKVGEWVVNRFGDAWYIDSFDGKNYQVSNGDNYCYFPIENQNEMHLWTIQDAKDGDVLFCKGDIKNSNGIKYERICLFNNLGNAFFTLTKTSNYVEEYDIDVNIDYPDNTVPATKEQKEILFMVMTEAGYIFNFEKKELKKIENEIEIPFGAKDSELQESTYYIPKGFHAEIDDDKVVIKKGEQKHAWSEEDRIRITNCIQLIGKTGDGEVEWLKSLESRILPQTKQEWSEDDIKMFVNIKACLRNANKDYSREVDWLISLKDRVQPQNLTVTDEELAQAKKNAYNDALDKIEYHSGEPTFDDGWSAAIWYLKKRISEYESNEMYHY